MRNVLLCVWLVLGSASALAEEVTIFSTRASSSFAPLMEKFTNETGITVKLISDTHPNLMTRLKAETADLFLTKDVTFLQEAVEAGVFQPMSEAPKDLPSKFMEENRLWALLSYRARVIMHHKDKVSPAELSTYENLADPKWKGRLCLRTSTNSYNKAFLAGLLSWWGADRLEAVLKGFVANLAEPVIDGDTKVLEAIAAGRCDVGITNTYYLAGILKKNPEFPVRPFFPNQDGMGAHLNGYGIGVVKGAPNPAAAERLIAFLFRSDVQEAFAAPHFEYPALPGARAVDVVEGFGSFRSDKSNLGRIGEYLKPAQRIAKDAGYL